MAKFLKVMNKRLTAGSGFVLVAVLWLIMLLSIMAMGLSYSSRQSVRSMSALVGGTQARYLAQGGVQLALANLLNTEAGERLLGDNESVVLELPHGEVELSVIDESGKIDINVAGAELLARLFVSVEVSEEDAEALADAVLDYRDEDDLPGVHGAEDKQYQSADLPWESKDSAFTNVDEMQRVYGMERWIYQAIVPHLTIYSRSKGVNPEVASLQILQALSDDSLSALESYVDQRRENHLEGLAMPESPLIERQFVSRSRGETFTISASGRTPSGQRSAITTTVRLKRGENQETIEILNWQPYRLSPPDSFVSGESPSLYGKANPEPR